MPDNTTNSQTQNQKKPSPKVSQAEHHCSTQEIAFFRTEKHLESAYPCSRIDALRTKIDKLSEQDWGLRFAEMAVLFISASNKKNIEVLKQRLIDLVIGGQLTLDDGTIVTNARHYEALRLVDEAVSDIRKGLDENISGDLIALDIRRCLHYLGEITGEITNEDQLDYIFSKFCIGK